jgi:hypothetical protein
MLPPWSKGSKHGCDTAGSISGNASNASDRSEITHLLFTQGLSLSSSRTAMISDPQAVRTFTGDRVGRGVKAGLHRVVVVDRHQIDVLEGARKLRRLSSSTKRSSCLWFVAF